MEWTEFMKKYPHEAGCKTAWEEFRDRGCDVSSISRAVIQP